MGWPRVSFLVPRRATAPPCFVARLTPLRCARSYASKPSLDLSLGGVDMAELVRLLRDRAKVVMLKLPLNFNVKGFTERIGDAAQIAETRKMARVLVIMLRTNPSKRAVKRGRED